MSEWLKICIFVKLINNLSGLKSRSYTIILIVAENDMRVCGVCVIIIIREEVMDLR